MVQITLKAKFHSLIIALMPDRAQPAAINYINQVRRAIVGAYDGEQDITVQVEELLVQGLYKIIGSQQERLVSADNKAIKEALVPQLMGNEALLNAIITTTADNAAETEVIRQAGVDFILSILP